jgi:hypothetical protein
LRTYPKAADVYGSGRGMTRNRTGGPLANKLKGYNGV